MFDACLFEDEAISAVVKSSKPTAPACIILNVQLRIRVDFGMGQLLRKHRSSSLSKKSTVDSTGGKCVPKYALVQVVKTTEVG